MDVRLITLAEGYEPYVYLDTKYTKNIQMGIQLLAMGTNSDRIKKENLHL